MGSVDEDEGSVEVVLNLSKRLNEEKEGRNSNSKRPRISEPVNQGFVVSEEIGGEKRATIENGVMGSGEGRSLNAEVVPCSRGLNSTPDETMDFDLNAGIWDMEIDEFVPLVTEKTVEIIDIASDDGEDEDSKTVDVKDVFSVPLVTEKTVEIIDIASDDGEDEDSKTVDAKDVSGRSKQIEKETNDEYLKNFDFGLGLLERSFGISSSASGERRYTIKEKGKGKVSDSWLSLGLNGEDSSICKDSALRIEQEQRIEEFDCEDEDSKMVDAKDVSGRSKQIEKETNDEYMKNFDFRLGLLERNFGISSSASGERRYTREEKGKAKVSDSWLSLGLNGEDSPIFRDSALKIEQEQRIEEFDAQMEEENDDDEEALDFINGEEQHDDFPNIDELEGNLNDISRRARELRELHRRETALRFARSEGYSERPFHKENARFESDELLGKSPGPFSTALKMVQERNTKSPQQLIKWEPSRKGCNVSRHLVPSLLDLSLKVLSQNVEAIVSLELVPDILRQKLTDLLCNLRKMGVLTLELLIEGSPTEIRVKDSSWLTEQQLLKTLGNFNARKLMVLQLDLCGQCNLDYIMSTTFSQFSNSLPKLGIISLKGACRLSDNGLKALLASAPSLQSINLSQCSLLTHDGINILATSLGSLLKELYIDECLKIDAMLALPALKKFEHLEVLSVAGIQTVSDQFIRDLMATCGQTIKELDLANCLGLTNYSLKFIGIGSTNLRSLNISNLEKLTDLGLQFLADGCRSIETLKFCRNNFSDEAIAAFLETSGQHLKDLSLNNVTLVGPCTAISLAKCSRKLLSLDLSWCRKITNEAMGLIVDSCLSLKLVKLFGCTQITDIFLNGHSNPQVQILGLNLTPILETTDTLKHYGVLLRYSPLASLSEF